ncbi:hypothetical protein [Actinomadura opuntiae]|uniref:hypothetical protein n=1 Tax=Actinomadura sp. OS1-43 TaxID=604315 RepID=UPI00255A8C3C|nr:hypothetical protein [Actinomadura sp. OS1-43]MDL4817933.1 hypothetical protein [Actinomadura sp. OS1-43]
MTLTRTGPTDPPRATGPAWPLRLLRERSVRIALVCWAAANAAAVAIAGGTVPFDWPMDPDRATGHRLVEFNTRFVEVFALMGVVYWLTRKRPIPDQASRAPARPAALRETLWLTAYGVAGLIGGYALGRGLGYHPFSLHLDGSMYGTRDRVVPAEAIIWAAYCLVVFAVVPVLFFLRRYPARSLNLVSSDRRGDTRVIVAVLAIEATVQYLAMHPETFHLGARQLATGLPLTFALYLAGAVLPAMVFVYCVLVPRIALLTGSTATTVILGGVAYAALHVWDGWTLWDGPAHGTLTVIFLLATYFGPGMFKTWATVRTGNAWVHVWAYHAFVPHTVMNTPLIVRVFRL